CTNPNLMTLMLSLLCDGVSGVARIVRRGNWRKGWKRIHSRPHVTYLEEGEARLADENSSWASTDAKGAVPAVPAHPLCDTLNGQTGRTKSNTFKCNRLDKKDAAFMFYLRKNRCTSFFP